MERKTITITRMERFDVPGHVNCGNDAHAWAVETKLWLKHGSVIVLAWDFLPNSNDRKVVYTVKQPHKRATFKSGKLEHV